jgi:hypothetical protein
MVTETLTAMHVNKDTIAHLNLRYTPENTQMLADPSGLANNSWIVTVTVETQDPFEADNLAHEWNFNVTPTFLFQSFQVDFIYGHKATLFRKQ